MADDTVDDLKDEIQALRDELQRLKQEKRSDAASARSADAVEEEIGEVQDQVEDVMENSGWSRRDFMKMLGGGAAGLGAAAMLPSMASAFKVESDNALQYFNQSGTGKSSFEVTPGGNLTTTQIGTASDKIQDIHASSVTTDQLNDAVYYIATSDDPQTVADNAGANSKLVFLPGTHSLPLTSTTDGHGLELDNDHVEVEVKEGATVQLADNELSGGDTAKLISIANGVSDVDIVGNGTIDGNKTNNSVSSTEDFALIEFRDNVSDVRIGEGLSLDDSPGQMIRGDATSGNEASGVRITDFDSVDCEEGVVWTFVNDVIISEFDIENIGTQDAIEPAESEDWLVEKGVIDTVETAAFDLFTNARDGKIAHVTVRNAAQGGDHGILAATTGTQPFDIDIVDVTLISTGTSANNSSARGIKIDAGSTNITFEDCEVRGSQHAGWEIAGDECDVKDSKAINNGHYGINYTGDDAKIQDNTCRQNDRDGVRSDGVDNTVQNNTCKNNNQAGLNNFGGMVIDANADRNTVTGNHVFDDQGTPTQDKGIRLDSCTNSLVEKNHVHGNSEDQILDNSGSGTEVQRNFGYTTENSGEADFSGDGSTTSFTVAHGLDEIPSSVVLTQKAVTSAGEDIEDYDAGGTNITVNFTTAPANNETATVGWDAKAH